VRCTLQYLHQVFDVCLRRLSNKFFDVPHPLHKADAVSAHVRAHCEAFATNIGVQAYARPSCVSWTKEGKRGGGWPDATAAVAVESLKNSPRILLAALEM
jgi:hypothetical protein